MIVIPFASSLTDALFAGETSEFLWLALVAIAPTVASQVFAGFLLGVGTRARWRSSASVQRF